MKRIYLKKIFSLYLVSLLLGACSPESNNIVVPQHPVTASTAELKLSIEAPNDVVLRSATEATDPLTTVSHIRLVFYREVEQSYRVAFVRELRNLGGTLNDLSVRLPQGDYKLVAIANATPKLVAQTQENCTLDLLTAGEFQSTSDLRNVSERTPRLSIPMLNAQGAVSVTSNDFASASSVISIQIEPALARILVYGTPEVVRGTKGTAPTRYTVVNLTKEMSYLRMLGKLEGGIAAEQPSDNSPRSSRYASCKLWETWSSRTPSNTDGVATLTPTAYKKPDYWTTALPTVEEYTPLLSSTSSLYCKEGVVPPNAYLQGLVPTAVVAFAYIPEGLTLSGEEGWMEYYGKVYSETQVKEMIRSKKFDNPALQAAINKANLTQGSFTEGFSREGINYYHKALNYYTIPIRHFASATEVNAYGRYGVVRGNEYRIKLVRVLQRGAPIPIDFANNLNPIEENQTLNHSLSTTAVERREQDVEL